MSLSLRPGAINARDMAGLDQLIGAASVDSALRERLLVHRDPALARTFGVSDATWRWLRTISADTLPELCQAILDRRAVRLVSVETESAASDVTSVDNDPAHHPADVPREVLKNAQ